MTNRKSKNCKICNKDFIPNSNSQKFCSPNCFNKHWKNYMEKYYKLHREEILQYKKPYGKKYYESNKEDINKRNKDYYELNKEKISKQHEEYSNIHKEERVLYMKEYFQLNKKDIYQYVKNKKKIDINFKIRCCLATRIWLVLKKNHKSKTTLKLFGCSVEELKKHLEYKFTLGMSFSNYGKWHIDHIRPCSSFDLSKPSEQRKCFHYTNLQPLWAKDNIMKSDKLI